METHFEVLNTDATIRDISIILEEDPNLSKVAIVDENEELVAAI